MDQRINLKIPYVYKVQGSYPKHEGCYSPDRRYPEYVFGETATSDNLIYEAVRESLYGMGFDQNRFGTREWNPLGDIISPGNTVLVKPNWVSNKNNNSTGGTDCLVTHTSIIRAVIDYCVIALGGCGKIILGDAPIQAADFDRILMNYHINELVDFYATKGITVEVRDLRDITETVMVEVGENSAFANLEGEPKYHVMDYVEERTRSYHAGGSHKYAINQAALEADVILNLPKPKTHKLAGVTGAMKNLVGIVTEKETLPHERIGTPANGGDSSNKETLVGQSVYRLRHKSGDCPLSR